MVAEPDVENVSPPGNINDGDTGHSMNCGNYFDGGSNKKEGCELALLDKVDFSKVGSTAPATPPKLCNIDERYAQFPALESEILKRQIYTPELSKGAGVLYRYASRYDLLIIAISSVCAIASGASLPLMTVIFGNLQNTFQQYFNSGGAISHDELVDEISKLVLYFVYLAIGAFAVTYISTVGFIYTGEHISGKIREHYLESCMRQNIGFFDTLGAGEVTTRITADTNLIQDGISEKISLSIAALATFITAFVIGFVNYWKLTLILLSTVFALLLNVGICSKYILKNNKASLEAYAQGGSLAEEVISSIRNTIAFGTQDRLAKRYDKHLAEAEHYGWRFRCAMASMVAGMMLILYLNYGLAFWQGSKFVVNGIIPVSKVLTITMSVVVGAFQLANVAPNAQAFTTAVAAAAKIFNTIDRQSPLDPSGHLGDKIENLQGSIRLSNIKHIYPSRPEVAVMDGVCLEIPAGKTTALVGASGCGKSTVVGLVERFYDPVVGAVYLDGHDISKLNLKWLRQQMALVSQEPTLFSTTIFNNIRHGLIGTKFENESNEKQRELVTQAAVKANAHDFVSSLPEGYETNVGQRGFLLSGGQKQRIAIARAIISDPKILLLDEATSALDTKSEGVIQAALETAATGRTTIVIAHRLSTIRHAHNIVVMSAGRIIEQGTHDQLLAGKGAYFDLVSAQNIATDDALTTEHEREIERKEEDLAIEMLNNEGERIEDDDNNTTTKLRHIFTQDSASGATLSNRKAEETNKQGLWTLMKFILSFNRPDWKLMIIGFIFSAICGGGNPTSAVFFAKQVTTLTVPLTNANREQVKKDSDFWSTMYLMLAIVQLIAFE